MRSKELYEIKEFLKKMENWEVSLKTLEILFKISPELKNNENLDIYILEDDTHIKVEDFNTKEHIFIYFHNNQYNIDYVDQFQYEQLFTQSEKKELLKILNIFDEKLLLNDLKDINNYEDLQEFSRENFTFCLVAYDNFTNLKNDLEELYENDNYYKEQFNSFTDFFKDRITEENSVFTLENNTILYVDSDFYN